MSNTPKEVWLRIAGGGTSLPSGKTYTTMVGDDREQDRHTRYVRADELEKLTYQLVKYQDALKEVDGCFQAAYAEGLSERLAESDQGFCTLAELFLRRVVFAHHAAINALTDDLQKGE